MALRVPRRWAMSLVEACLYGTFGGCSPATRHTQGMPLREYSEYAIIFYEDDKEIEQHIYYKESYREVMVCQGF